MTGADPWMPGDTPLAAVIADLEAAGFVGQFVPLDAGVIRCVTGGHVFAAEPSAVERSRRLEGVSDPADMLIVLGLRCPICGALGTLVLHYGPEASGEEADALVLMAPS